MNNQANNWGKKSTTILLSALIGLFTGSISFADPITHTLTVPNTDWTSAGVGGVGTQAATINISGTSGTINNARLYWHGTGNPYNNPGATINGNAVTGTEIGQASSNCWGNTNSAAYAADVTAFVSGDGAYLIDGLVASGGDVNGASLVVTFDDGNPNNNRDVAFFEGNDSNFPEGFPGETSGWHATLTPINYDGSSAVNIQFHNADGQSFADNSVTLTTANGSFTILDDATLWDGLSVPDSGNSRAGNGSLWDIHTFDITSAFGGVAGSDLSMDLDGQAENSDCLGLVLALVDFAPGSIAPVEPQEPVDVPTMSNWSLILMAAMLALLGVFAHRRQKA